MSKKLEGINVDEINEISAKLEQIDKIGDIGMKVDGMVAKVDEFTDDESSEEEPPNNPKAQIPVVISPPQVPVVDNPPRNLVINLSQVPVVDNSPQNLVVNLPNNNDPEIELNLEEMALNANQNISLNDALVCVPRFEGNPGDLIDFATCCRDAKGMLPEAAEYSR
ncbi:hypothetical protein KQX54_006345 [Cotesia glomerata]|uniref:Uncharacterized protein n=1 Tax=Cotesia glomerata TaxID=32391 RepID=A0AAV7IYY0_COTGL|nr:hypothetical protein KQX54_006345 [Cotesia glomerata]